MSAFTLIAFFVLVAGIYFGKLAIERHRPPNMYNMNWAQGLNKGGWSQTWYPPGHRPNLTTDLDADDPKQEFIGYWMGEQGDLVITPNKFAGRLMDSFEVEQGYRTHGKNGGFCKIGLTFDNGLRTEVRGTLDTDVTMRMTMEDKNPESTGSDYGQLMFIRQSALDEPDYLQKSRHKCPDFMNQYQDKNLDVVMEKLLLDSNGEVDTTEGLAVIGPKHLGGNGAFHLNFMLLESMLVEGKMKRVSASYGLNCITPIRLPDVAFESRLFPEYPSHIIGQPWFHILYLRHEAPKDKIHRTFACFLVEENPGTKVGDRDVLATLYMGKGSLCRDEHMWRLSKESIVERTFHILK